MNKHAPQWIILGAGAIGSLWASCAYRAGRPMPMLLRSESVLADYQQRSGIGFTAIDGSSLRLPLPATTVSHLDQPITHLLICTKAQQTLEAVGQLGEQLADDATVVLLQNGLGVAEQLREHYPALQLLQASTTEGAFRPGPFQLVHAGRGQTLIGNPFQADVNIQAVAQSLSVPPLTVAVCEDIEKVLWRKLAINCAINPLTALHRCRNGELLEQPEIKAQLDAVIDEILLLSTALNRASWVEGLRQQIYQVARDTGANRSSMLQDVLAGRETEIAFINGYLLRLAGEFDVELPTNRGLIAPLNNKPGHH